jgi:RsiW-degrading membrane proteinase PrsW (M82 family)
MGTSQILSLIPAPVVAIALYALLKYKNPGGSFGLFYKTFLLGVIGIIPVYLIDQGISWLHLNHLHSMNRTMFYAFVLTGSIYEIWKFIILRFFVFSSRQVHKTLDLIFYSLIIAAGFTSAYSVYALFYAPKYISVALYAISIGPAFVSIAIIMGYFAGLALNRKFALTDFATGLFIAIVFHGIYRFCLLTTDTLLLYMAMAGMLTTSITFLVFSLRTTEKSK